MQVAREDDARNPEGEECFVAFDLLTRGKRLKEEGFGIADDLQALVGEVARESGEHQARAVDGWLTNDALEPAGPGDEVEFKGFGVLGIEPLYSDGVTLHGGREGNGVVE